MISSCHYQSVSLGTGDIKAVLASLPQLRPVPTGGVSADNAGQYLKAGASALGVGGKLVDKAVVARGDWVAITAGAERLVAAVKFGIRPAASA